MNDRGEEMDISEFSFLNPSPDFREMNILKGITENHEVSQQKLSRISGVVPSMINRYISDLEEKGYIKKEGENRRRMKYILTEDGIFRLQFLTISYLREVAKLYVQSRETFGKVLDMLSSEGYNGILLYGAGIIGGILADVLKTEGMDPVAFVDDSPVKQGEQFHDLKVYSPEEVSKLKYDVVIIASFRHASKIARKAKEVNLKNVMVFEISDSGEVSIKKIKK
jgi:predicted transcriptional regulator